MLRFESSLYVIDMNQLLHVDHNICWWYRTAFKAQRLCALLLLLGMMDQVPHQCVVVEGKERPGTTWGFLAVAKGEIDLTACALVVACCHLLSLPSMTGSGLLVFVVPSPVYMGEEKENPGESLYYLSSSPEVPRESVHLL